MMIRMQCDGCGKQLGKGELRYSVKIDVRAAYDQMEIGLADLFRDHREELRALVDQIKDEDPQRLEETVYKLFQLDLCPPCQRAYIRDPLRFHPEQPGAAPPVDIDAFLRSLGLGGNPPDKE
jgi:hypothetical protein